jgi:hypothetical protein
MCGFVCCRLVRGLLLLSMNGDVKDGACVGSLGLRGLL